MTSCIARSPLRVHSELCEGVHDARGWPQGRQRGDRGVGARFWRRGAACIRTALAELDFRTGQVLDAIDQAGIADNTLLRHNYENVGRNAAWLVLNPPFYPPFF